MSTEMHGRTVADACDPVDLSPRRPDNRPGLGAIDYRIGRHSDFLARMLWGLPRETVGEPPNQTSPLRPLRARSTDDPAVALIDAFATTLDVLTFYQERIANEGYLRTAAERLSVLELSRTIGYELRPGVAASVNLAFTVEDADDPFRVVEVPAGVQVLSIPAKPEDRPQTFETIAPITARAEWNAIPVRTQRPQIIAMYHDGPEGAGDEGWKHGDLFLLDLDGSFDLSSAAEGDKVTISKPNAGQFLPVTPGLDISATLDELAHANEANPELPLTIQGLRVSTIQVRGTGLALQKGLRLLAVGVGRSDDGKPIVRTQAFRLDSISEDTDYGLTELVLQRLGKNVGKPKPLKLKFLTAVLPKGNLVLDPIPFNAVTASTVVKKTYWPGPALSAFIKLQAWPRVQLMLFIRQPPELEPPKLGEASAGVFVMRQSAGFFGDTAPRWETLAKPDNTRGGAGNGDPYANPWDSKTSGAAGFRSIWEDSQGKWVIDEANGINVYLDREVAEIAPDSWAIFERPDGTAQAFRVGRGVTQSRTDFGITAKVSGLSVLTDQDLAPDVSDAELKKYLFRAATARVASQPLTLGGLPIREAVAEGTSQLTLDGFYLDMEPGEAISVVGKRADTAGITDGETLIIDGVEHIGGFTRLTLATGTVHSYALASLRANANVAPATHGESGSEALGSGDATLANQSFRLTRAPLTFVSARTDSGTQTTLVVRVNRVAWEEVDALYNAGPDDQVYEVRVDDDGTTRVVFGDGVHGKRLPTGSFNVTAEYRAGMGVAGNVGEDTLTLLKTRPLGIRGVTNLSPARGAAPPEALEDARTRGPQSVRTLGRIVSLTDYEDFALSFAGIGKAKVTALWRGRKQVIHLSVAPAVEGVFSPTDQTLLDLVDAIEARRDPGLALIVAPHAARYFQLQAKVVYDPRYVPEDVQRAITDRLLVDFGYASRPLAEPVSAAAVVAAIQGVPGVVYVDLNVLAPYADGGAPATSLASVLRANAARLDSTSIANPTPILPAELLAVIATGIDLAMEVDRA